VNVHRIDSFTCICASILTFVPNTGREHDSNPDTTSGHAAHLAAGDVDAALDLLHDLVVVGREEDPEGSIQEPARKQRTRSGIRHPPVESTSPRLCVRSVPTKSTEHLPCQTAYLWAADQRPQAAAANALGAQ